MDRKDFISGPQRDRDSLCWCGKPHHKDGEWAHEEDLGDGSVQVDIFIDVSKTAKSMGMSEENLEKLIEKMRENGPIDLVNDTALRRSLLREIEDNANEI